ncbi:YqgE/AlgH family protein [Arcticibacter tournemirensis]|uniref:YqgE/AlgH family protein n=1 Tax=Arcticibacter tournemirensis TaxID=699437 RepID=A0A4Q0M821_9SPHI|nr:YqgE/AlgH family protein [Arcticibacter tournemirensis]RXF68876.1 YqgE/AlgH family protein [Arcticibacter tournemirensis]
MLNEVQPKTASLLISEPFMLDPNFKRSVVLLAEHNEEGTIGYVLNQKSDFVLSDVIAECADASFPIYIGGPVGNDSLHFLHRCYDRMNSGTEIGKGIYWGGNFETLKLLISNKQVQENEIRFFVGYSGWDIGQLAGELVQNSWLVTNQYNPDFIFTEEEENLWKDIVIGLGPKYAHIVNFPENPMWN